LVEVRAASYAYSGLDGPVPVLQSVSLAIRRGELIAVLGASGSGKTTLLNLIGGLERPVTGEIRVNGRNIAELSGRKLEQYRQHEVGFVFQFFNLLPTLTALENVRLGLEAMEPVPRDSESRSRRMLKAVGLDGKEDRFPGQLSGGEQQRVAIARALAKGAPLILADEPTGNLDEDTAAGIMDLFEEMVRVEGVTLLLITHDVEIARRTDRVLRLTRGHIESCTGESIHAVA
jgi:putative ABC transport system ATP-binding protein